MKSLSKLSLNELAEIVEEIRERSWNRETIEWITEVLEEEG